MASAPLFKLFEAQNKEEYAEYLRNYPSLELINKELVDEYLSDIIDEAWAYRESLPGFISSKQQFYMYMFGEVFRKYFGPEIVMQSRYIINRSPFLDYNLAEALLKTSLAGIYQEFRETNPLKRFHGQILYAHILKITYPKLLSIILDRGYKPADFLSLAGRIRIVAGHFKGKLLKKRNKESIPSYSLAYYEFNSKNIEQALGNAAFLNKEHMLSLYKEGGWHKSLHDFVNVLSMELFYQLNKKQS